METTAPPAKAPESLPLRPATVPPGAVRVVVSPDRMVVSLEINCIQAAGLSAEETRAVLAAEGIQYGIDAAAIEKLVEAIREGGKKSVKGSVAKGRKKIGPTPEKFELAHLSAKEARAREEASRSLRELAESRKAEELSPDLADFPLVNKGEVVARLQPGTVGVEGVDVYGEKVSVDDDSHSSVTAGEGIAVSKDGSRFLADRYGYVCMADNEVWIASAIMLSGDAMACYLVDLRANGVLFEREPLIEGIKSLNIVGKPKEKKLYGLLKKKAAGARAHVLMRGREAQKGVDGRLEWEKDLNQKSGAVREDGSVDFKQRNLSVGVQEKDALGVLYPPTKGEPGRTLLGEELEAEGGDELQVEAGEGVRAVEEAERKLFYAECEGNAALKNGELQVAPLLEHSGDIDYTTGNIDFNGEVIIRGMVRGGFSVKAQKGVTVQAMENGAEIASGGAVVVQKGIVGNKTKVFAGEGIQAQFVQDATLLSKKDVEVSSYIFNARVQAGTDVKVQGKGGKGGIVGGRISAGGEIVAPLIGSDSGTATHLLLGVDRELMKKKKKAEEGLNTCQMFLDKLMTSVGLTEPHVDQETLGRLVNGVGPKRQQQVLGQVKKMEKLIGVREQLEEQMSSLSEQAREKARDACVKVQGYLYPGTVVSIGEKTYQPREELMGLILKLSAEGKIIKGALQKTAEES